MSKDTDVSFLLNQLDDLKKRVYRMQKGESMTRKVAGYGIGIGLTGLAIGAYLLIKIYLKDGA
tara:strand:- start:107 stop:295 length:189 start_codon:yes stop_codon:yes gene_type:complete